VQTSDDEKGACGISIELIPRLTIICAVVRHLGILYSAHGSTKQTKFTQLHSLDHKNKI